MKTMLWNVTYNRRYEIGKGHTFTCEQWPYKGSRANRAMQVAAANEKEAEKKIRKDLDLPQDIELYVHKANNYIIV